MTRKKNILIITGSSRKNGNSDIMASKFCEGVNESDNTITMYDTSQKKFLPCTGCLMCWKNNIPCILDDATTELQDYLVNADVLVFVTPLYWFNFSGNIKLMLDKINPFVQDNSPFDISNKETYLLACGNDNHSTAFDGLITTYKEMVNYIGWNDRGILTISEVLNKGDILNKEELKNAYEMGKSV